MAMKNKVVKVPSIRNPIKRSPGFVKKELSTYKLDILGLCGFGCRYCSSNWGNYLRINRQGFAELTKAQVGKQVLPADDPSLTFIFPDILKNLESQLRNKSSEWGKGDILVFSMLTDGFSPSLIKDGTTRAVLDLVLEKTSFRVRVLTKNAIVGNTEWIDFFKTHPERFVVGLSIGTLDDSWSQKMEMGTPPPFERLRAHENLQNAGIPTFGMLCPVFPATLDGDSLERLVDRLNPTLTEHIWVEPYNDRQNWHIVQGSYQPNSQWHKWFSDVYEAKRWDLWSEYATDMYVRLRDKANAEGWINKLRFLLYESRITETDAERMGGIEGVLLQGTRDDEGFSKNKHLAHYQ